MADPTENKPERRRTDVAALVLAGVIVLFAVVNSDRVKVHWVVTSTRTPLFVVTGVSLLIGAAIGWLAGRRRGGD